MDFLNEFGKRVSNVARSVTEKSKESAEVSRLNAELRQAQDALEKLYARFGKVCFAMRQGVGSAETAEELALRIRAAILQEEEAAARRDAAREMKRCPGCGAVHPKEARFCSNCGKRLPEEAPKPEPVEPGEYCPDCGAKREYGELRCAVCGASFDAPGKGSTPPTPPLPTPPAGPDVEEPAAQDADDWE